MGIHIQHLKGIKKLYWITIINNKEIDDIFGGKEISIGIIDENKV